MHQWEGWFVVRKVDPAFESEFGDGGGLIDPIRRAARVIGQDADPTGYQRAGEELWEIYATNPSNVDADPATAELGVDPAPTPWQDPTTAKGTS
jgi:hypothetical protein